MANVTPEVRELADKIRITGQSGGEVSTSLATNRRVIARVTDGIYRQPASALRELISNAYDADASEVVILTDAPRFEKISVRDNGNGMTPDVLAHLLKNIGGSAKRTNLGAGLGVTSSERSDRSPAGRALIGKLGIGIFSVSQLTRGFQIITKTRGDDLQTVATIRLRQFADDNDVDIDDDMEFDAGEVRIWQERSTNPEQHGTTIVLNNVRSQTRESLQSVDIWEAVDKGRVQAREMGVEAPESYIPEYHIGRLGEDKRYVDDGGEKGMQNLPWSDGEDGVLAFNRMVDAVWDALDGNTNPSLERLFDSYLRMLWDLSLALPLPYVAGHLLDEPSSDWAQFFSISNQARRGVASTIEPSAGSTVRDLFTTPPTDDYDKNFRVRIDSVELRRPIKFRGRPVSSHSIDHPLVFLGSYSNNFNGIDRELTGGPLSFDAYFYWNPKIAPVDHRGIMVRVHGSSGAPFDNTFFRYQISEQTRLRQLTCEIFVREGVEAALNIDREAFNTAHPHMTVLIRWVHNALRQIATAQKRVAANIRADDKQVVLQGVERETSEIVARVNDLFTGGEELVPDVEFVPTSVGAAHEDPAAASEGRKAVVEVFRVRGVDSGRSSSSTSSRRKLEAIVKLLSVSGSLSGMTTLQRDELISSIYEVLSQP